MSVSVFGTDVLRTKYGHVKGQLAGMLKAGHALAAAGLVLIPGSGATPR
jgi:hypothetical protein